MKRTSLSFRYIRQDELLELDVQWIPEEDGCNRGIFLGILALEIMENPSVMFWVTFW